MSLMKKCLLVISLAAVLGLRADQATTNAPVTRGLPGRLNPAARPLTPPTPAPQLQAITPAAPVRTAPAPALGSVPAAIMAWDADTKEQTTKPGELEAHFVYYFTNVSPENLIINSAAGSCGCTVAKLPPVPWTNAPGAVGEIPVTMNVAGKSGTVFKTVTINTDKGQKLLTVRVNITPPEVAPAAPMDRNRNQELAKVDRQAVFKGDCARCHGVPVSAGKYGKDLFKATCAVCHEAEHRATMVPDLHAMNHDSNADFWKTWISLGKPGSLMPAFAASEGGPLDEGQIHSLVEYLVATIPAQAVRPPAAK